MKHESHCTTLDDEVHDAGQHGVQRIGGGDAAADLVEQNPISDVGR